MTKKWRIKIKQQVQIFAIFQAPSNGSRICNLENPNKSDWVTLILSWTLCILLGAEAPL